ncbi:MAG: hypothetical protein ACE5I4_09230, partial [Thermoplasmata archaeon]
MRGKRHSTFSRVQRLVIIPILASLLFALPPAGGDHQIAGVEVFLIVVGSGTAAPFSLFFDKSEIILGPTPVFVNVTFTNMDTENNLPHNFTTFLNGTFHETPLLSVGETGWVEFWINETGRFPYWCSVGNHRADGMEGFFVVSDTGDVGGPPVEVGPQGVALRAYWIGLIGIFSMVAVILVSYFVIKYESRHHTDQRE